jgi:GNAT superfamily N-acetyltransferase
MTEVRDVTTWYLEMRAVSQLVPAKRPLAPHRIERIERPTAAFARYLYTAVGGRHYWTDRLPWSGARWDERLAQPELQLYTLQVDGVPAGYVELEWQAPSDVQLVYFGLLPEHCGRGWGGWLLTRAVQLAWQLDDVARVWVHTCTLDAPFALANYRARGFVVYREKTVTVELDASAPSPSPRGIRNDMVVVPTS